MKYCSKCKTDKPLDDFRDDKHRAGGKFIYCKLCHKAYAKHRYNNQPGVREKHLAHHKEQRQNNPEYRARHKKYTGDYYMSVEGRAKTLLKGTKRREPGSTVTLDHIMAFLLKGICPMTGFPFILTTNYRIKSGRNYNAFAPSVDRIDTTKGYTNENTRVVIWQYNVMKHEISDGELYIISKAFVDRFENAYTR